MNNQTTPFPDEALWVEFAKTALSSDVQVGRVTDVADFLLAEIRQRREAAAPADATEKPELIHGLSLMAAIKRWDREGTVAYPATMTVGQIIADSKF